MSDPQRWFPLDRIGVVICGSVGVILFVLWIAPAEVAAKAVQENGPIEMISALVLGCGVAVAGWRLWQRCSWGWLSGTVMMLWACLRELDFQKRFTYRSIESTGFYLRDIAPLETKVLVLLILSPFVAAAFHLLWMARKEIPVGFSNRERWVGHLILATGTLLVAQFSEKILGATLVEEPLELAFAALLVAMILAVGGRVATPRMD